MAVNQWLGCDWQTAFGARRLDLNGMRSDQTRILSDATSGDESKAWEEATAWLEQVDQDALGAQAAASLAVTHFENQHFAKAIEQIDLAVALEAKYRKPVTWTVLRELLIAASAADSYETKTDQDGVERA